MEGDVGLSANQRKELKIGKEKPLDDQGFLIFLFFLFQFLSIYKTFIVSV